MAITIIAYNLGIPLRVALVLFTKKPDLVVEELAASIF